MAAFVGQVHNVANKVLKTSSRSDTDTNKIVGELMQLTRTVVTKNTFPPMNADKYHLAQPSRILSRSVVHWRKNLIVHSLDSEMSATHAIRSDCVFQGCFTYRRRWRVVG